MGLTDRHNKAGNERGGVGMKSSMTGPLLKNVIFFPVRPSIKVVGSGRLEKRRKLVPSLSFFLFLLSFTFLIFCYILSYDARATLRLELVFYLPSLGTRLLKSFSFIQAWDGRYHSHFAKSTVPKSSGEMGLVLVIGLLFVLALNPPTPLF